MSFCCKYRPYPYFIIVLGVCFSCWVFSILEKSHVNNIRDRFDHVATESFLFIENDFKWHADALANLGNFFLASEYVDDHEFYLFTKPYFENHKSYKGFGWIEVSGDLNTNEFSYEIKKFVSKNSQDNLNSFFSKEESENLKYKLLKSSREKRKTFIISKNINDGLVSKSIMIANPVFFENQNKLYGFSFSIFDLNGLISKAIDRDEKSFVKVVVYLKTQNDQPQLLYGERKQNLKYYKTKKINWDNQEIIFKFYPSNYFFKTNKNITSYIAFFVLLAFFFMIFLYLQQMIKRLEERVEHQRSEDMNRLQSEFMATMSHELRTPMNGVLGMAELILGLNPSSKIENYTKIILSSGETLQKIIDDILDFSKIEAGKMELESIESDLLEIVDEVAFVNAVKAREKAIEVVVHYQSGVEQFVFCDSSRIKQVLNNLVNNAVKFTNKGHILITVEEDKVLAEDKYDLQLKFSIKDTGIGLSQESQSRIFQKFLQADTSTTRKFGGTGLGLSISKSLVEMMGGKIGFQSEQGVGSTFWFTLPFVKNSKEKNSQSSPAILKDVRLLIVDDLSAIRELVCERLTDIGMRCDAAKDGFEALEMINKAYANNDPYKIVIIDYLMPKMNGGMLAHAISDQEHLKETCLVMLTAAGNPLGDEYFVEKGFSAYLSKPIRNHTLINSLATVWGEYKKGNTDILIRLDIDQFSKMGVDKFNPKCPDINILIAEDNLVNQVFIKEILEEMNASYKVASNGKEAIDILKHETFDLVFMDCLMPVMDGFEAVSLINKMKQKKEIKNNCPVIALTANAMKGDREKCIASGMSDYLSKPVRKNELKKMVLKWVNGKDLMAISLPQNGALKLTESGASDDPSVIIDRQANKMARDVLKTKYDEMAVLFIETSEDYIDNLIKYLTIKDFDEMVRPAHTLKSTSKQMGALKLAETAFKIEEMAKNNQSNNPIKKDDFEKISALIAEIKEVFLETKCVFYQDL